MKRYKKVLQNMITL